MIARGHQGAHGAPRLPAIELPTGAWLVLSEHTQGEPRQYPRLSLHPALDVETGARPASEASPPTPVTPIAPTRRRESALTITAGMASGVRTVEIPPGALPFRVGRSRNQALVIDWTHSDVSGHHLEIIALDESGAQVVVHGDNGVSLDGTSHGPGAQFKWNLGQTLVLSGGAGQASSCTLTLSRSA